MSKQIYKNRKPIAIDLFAGGGGLSLGLKNAGFKLVSAVEIDPRATPTYRANHPEVQLIEKDIRQVNVTDFKINSPVSLLAGCPPCQGFSSLTRKYKKVDPRNRLIFEMLRLVNDFKPMIIMMENVPGLSDRGRLQFNRFLREIRKLGYIVNWDVLQVADYGIPQSRRRLVCLAGLGFEIPIPKPTHSNDKDTNLRSWVTLKDSIGGMPKPPTLSKAINNGGPEAFNWHVVRDMSKENKERLRFAKPGKSRLEIPKKYRPDCHKSNGNGFPNVYGRLNWNEASCTITGGCTTLSKGRFGHPTQLRTLSVREAARLQTFPDSYVFATPFMEHVCDIIGMLSPVILQKS